MPEGAHLLAELGVELPEASVRPFHGIRYIDGDLVADGRFPDNPGLGIRRTTLHQALVDRARAVGVDLRWGVKATAVEDGELCTDSGRMRFRWMVGADGLKSRVRRWAGLEGPRAERRRFGVRRHFAVEPWSDLVEVHFARGSEAYVTPVGSCLVGVALLWSGGRGEFGTLLKRFPDLERRLAGAEAVSRDRGAGPFEQRCQAVVKGRLALVGDASGYVDPITGEGTSVAFQQAMALVAAFERDDLALYERAHRRIVRLPGSLARLMLWLVERPRLLRRVVAALAMDPAVFDHILAIHAGRRSLLAFGPLWALRLGRGLASVGQGR
jgi:flavin-dependent dehydrogenase